MKKLILIVALIILSGCAKREIISEKNSAWIGEWRSARGNYIEIFQNGGCNLKIADGTMNLSISGGSVSFASNTLVVAIGFDFIKKTYVVDTPPSVGQNKMKLAGIIFEKVTLDSGGKDGF